MHHSLGSNIPRRKNQWMPSVIVSICSLLVDGTVAKEIICVASFPSRSQK